MLEQFKQRIIAEGIHWRIVDEKVFIDFRDMTKAQEKKVHKIAMELNLQFDIADKGVLYFL